MDFLEQTLKNDLVLVAKNTEIKSRSLLQDLKNKKITPEEMTKTLITYQSEQTAIAISKFMTSRFQQLISTYRPTTAT